MDDNSSGLNRATAGTNCLTRSETNDREAREDEAGAYVDAGERQRAGRQSARCLLGNHHCRLERQPQKGAQTQAAPRHHHLDRARPQAQGAHMTRTPSLRAQVETLKARIAELERRDESNAPTARRESRQ